MADDASPRRKTVKVGIDDWEIANPSMPGVDFVDLLLDGRVSNGVIGVSLGTAVIDGDGPGQAVVATRLRMDLAFAQNLHRLLGELIHDGLNPPKPENPN